MTTKAHTPKAHKNAEFIKAYADGKDVQWKLANDVWYDVQSGDEHVLFGNHTFRIKPEQPWYRVGLHKDKSGYIPLIVNSEVDEQLWNQDICFVRWLTEHVPYDI